MFDGIAEHERRNCDFFFFTKLLIFFYCDFLMYFYLTI